MNNHTDMENIVMSNGKTVGEINREVRKAVEQIYLESWSKGIPVPFHDAAGSTFLANPDGSEDYATFNRGTRTYTITGRYAPAGCGRYAYLLQQ